MTLTFALSGVANASAQLLAAEYGPTSGSALKSLWTTTVSTTSDLRSCARGTQSCGTINIYRVRSTTEYTVHLWMRAADAGDDDGARATLLWNGTFHSCSAGVTRLDSKPYIQVTGPEAPGWEMVTFAAGEEYSLADASSQRSPYWSGLTAVDAEGYVVWRYHL